MKFSEKEIPLRRFLVVSADTISMLIHKTEI
jgi:hypothetical protein